MVIFVVGLLSAIMVFNRVIISNIKSANAVKAVSLCEERLEEIKNQTYNDIIEANFPARTMKIGAFPATQTVTIEGVWMPEGDLGIPDSSESFKKVTVRIDWRENEARYRELFTYISRR